MNIVILCGGTSTERDVSLKTSEKVANALIQKGHKCLLADVFAGFDKRPSFDIDQDIADAASKYREFSSHITEELKATREFFGPFVLDICKEADIVFLGLHGANGEDGKIQAAFDLMNIKYTGSGYLSSAIAMSKDTTKAVLSDFIPMPKGIILKKDDPVYERPDIPCVIKPANGGSSIGVTIVTDEKDYDKALENAFKYDETVLAEEFIDGRELTQGALNGSALPPVEICPGEGFYNYVNKYNGKPVEICPAKIDDDILKKMSEYTEAAGRILGLSVYYRLDYLLDKKGNLFCLEVNTLPGMTDTSLIPQEAAAVGISYIELCEMIINLSLEKYK